MSTISMLSLFIQYIVRAPREGKRWHAIERVFLNCLYNAIWVHYQCIWEEDRVRTQHIPVGTSEERFNMECHLCICLDHHHHFPNQLCLALLKHTRSTHRPGRQAKITAFTFRAQRGVWKGNFAFWPTGLKVTLLASCWRAASWPHRLWRGDERAQSSSCPSIDSAAFATSKPLRHSGGAPSPLKPYPFHANFYK